MGTGPGAVAYVLCGAALPTGMCDGRDGREALRTSWRSITTRDDRGSQVSWVRKKQQSVLTYTMFAGGTAIGRQGNSTRIQ